MIRKLRVQVTLLLTITSAIFIILFLTRTYLSTKAQLEEDCYSDMSYIISDISSANESTYPIAVVTVNYNGKMSLILNHLFTSDKPQILRYASSILKMDKSTGTIGDNIRYIRKSIGYSNIRIALVDYSADAELLATQRNNYIVGGSVFIIAFFFLSIWISRLITVPIDRAITSQKQFIANASHELKTPLTVIIANLGMIDAAALDDKDQSRLKNINAEATRMRKLIGSMLQIARYDSALLPVSHTVVNLSYIVQCSISIYEPLAFDKGLSLSSQIENNISISGNEQLLQQLIHIFLDNALKYCRKKGNISVRLTSTAKTVQLEVTNQGIPIDKNDLEKIFSSFYRANSTMASVEGNGLGLSIAQKIAENLGGKIWAESNTVAETNSFYVLFRK